jgi:predicted dehydrogenase
MLEDTYAHSPINKMFTQADVYGIGYDEVRSNRTPVQLGIIGAGGVALSKHIPAIMRLKTIWEPVELVAISRRSEEVGKKISSMYGCRWYADYRSMLKEEKLDGVLVLSPDNLHTEHTIACLEAGIPVLVEKPIARSLHDAQKMCDCSKEKKTPLMTVANKRFSPPYRRAKNFIKKGPVKNPALFCGKFNLGYDYVELLEAGTIHLFDIVRFFMGDVRYLRAFGVDMYHRNRLSYPVDNVVISLEFQSGAVGTVYTSSSALSLKPWERVEVYGNKAWLTIEDQYELILYESEEAPAKSWKPVIPNTLIFDEEFGGFMGLLENFLQVIRSEEKPVVTGFDGFKAFELDVASHLSIIRKETIELPLDPITADIEYRQLMKS